MADDGGGNVEGADGQVRASKYFNLFAIFLAALLGLTLRVAALNLALRVITRKKDKDNISSNDNDADGGVEEGVLEGGFARDLRGQDSWSTCRKIGPRRLHSSKRSPRVRHYCNQFREWKARAVHQAESTRKQHQ